MVCTTGKTEINYETKTAGGCGVAPFPSLTPFLSLMPRRTRNALRRLKRKTAHWVVLKFIASYSAFCGR
ncbi:hypothetical protein C3411_04990 [Citrobacter freundii complex sp. CFNIH5]|nr:hypothetical protein C2U38_05755 [Citrobacter freundii complex sp. CFNIH3]POV72257.1 hypothetical protein C3411_04990 [Citrobacter freundii complex sp. CFNIH5]